MSLAEFLYMGGYAFYVWISYALGLVVLLLNFVIPYRRERRMLREFARKAERSARRSTL